MAEVYVRMWRVVYAHENWVPVEWLSSIEMFITARRKQGSMMEGTDHPYNWHEDQRLGTWKAWDQDGPT